MGQRLTSHPNAATSLSDRISVQNRLRRQSHFVQRAAKIAIITKTMDAVSAQALSLR